MGIGITVLGSGSKGNSTVIHNENDGIMVDSGFSYRETMRRLKVAGLDGLNIHGILVTHEHTDHISGLRLCSERLMAPILATRKCAEAIHNYDDRIGQIATFALGGDFDIGCFKISPFPISHDAIEPCGFAIFYGDVKIGVATDVGFISNSLEYKLRGCNAMVIESNHDMGMLAASQRPWTLKQRIMGRQGHLSNDASRQLLEDIIDWHTKNIILAHLSHECNTEEKAMSCAKCALEHIGRTDINLQVAKQDAVLDTVWVG